MKTGGAKRSNIFGSTKDNHLNGDRLVFQSVSVGLPQIPGPPHVPSALFVPTKLAPAFPPVTVGFDRLCGGRRKNVSQCHKSKG